MKKRLYLFNELKDNELSKEGFGYVRNMLCDNGINRKRNGWRVIGEFRNEEGQPLKINGIFEFLGKEKSAIVVHAGEKLYECDYNLSILKEIPLGSCEIGNEKSYGIMYNGRLWLCCKSGLLTYDGQYLSHVHGIGIAYGPLTTIGIGEKWQGLKPQQVEEPNLLTGRRKNYLKGVQNEEKIHRFRLDAPVCFGKPFNVKARFRVASGAGKGDDWTSKYIGHLPSGDGINTIVNISFYIPSLKETTMQGTSFTVDDSGQEILVDDIEYLFRIEDGRNLVLEFDAVCPQGEDYNIEVDFYELRHDGGIFDKVNQMALCGTDTGKSVIAVTTGDNKLYYSQKADDLLYFPSGNVVSVGKDTQGIKGIIPMTNNYIGIYKDNSFYTLKINDDGSYKLTFCDNMVGCISPFTAKSLGNDCLALNDNGIFGINDTYYAEREVARPYSRSRSIKDQLDTLTKEEKRNATALVKNDEYWLFAGGRVYICTPKYKIKGSTSYDFTYQWWMLDNCPCVCASCIDDKIYMGREDGYIVAFDNGYVDCELVSLYSKNADFVFSQGDYLSITFNSCFGVKSGDKIRLSKHYYYAQDGDYIATKGTVYMSPGRFYDENGCVAIYTGTKIKLYNSEGIVVYEGKIKDTINDECGIKVEGNIGLNTDTPLKIYLERDEKTEYELKSNGTCFDVFYNKMPVCLLDADVERVYLVKSREVECEIITPLTDLDQRGNKTLYGISVTPSEDSRCMLDIGYNAKNGSSERSVVISSPIDFDDLDYKDLALSPAFKQDITVPFLERNFEYIRLRVGSRSGERLGIEKIALIYSTKK